MTVTAAAGGAQTQLPVFAVALRAGRAIGAGRAIVPALAAGASAPVEIPMTGAVTGTTVAVDAAPSAAAGRRPARPRGDRAMVG